MPSLLPPPPAPPTELHVLSWEAPLPAQAAAWLAQGAGWDGEGPLDLSDQLVVVSTRQSGRRLREALARLAEAGGRAVFPPRVRLPEQVPGEAAPPATCEGATARAPASHHESLLAWTEVLLAIDLEAFPDVFPLAPPTRSFAWAARLARQFIRVQSTLAENALRMADVAGTAGGSFPDSQRWSQLGDLERRFDAALAAHGLIDAQAARIAEMRESAPPPGIRRILLLATLDPHPLSLRLLARWASTSEVPVFVLVHGPAGGAHAGLFDAWGRPRVEAWCTRPLEFPDFEQRVHLCADPAAQSEAIVQMLRASAAANGTDGIDSVLGLGLADPEMVAPLRSAFAREGVTTFVPEGSRRSAGSLFQLLRALGELARDPTFAHAAAVARCPDVLRWLEREIDLPGGFSPARWLAGLDALHEQHLPLALRDACAFAEAGDGATARHPELAPGLERIGELRTLMTGGSFAEVSRAAPARLFAGQDFDLGDDRDSRIVESARAWIEVCESVAAAAARFPHAAPPDLWEVALQAFGETVSFDDKPPGAIELQGWLELPWDDSPHLLISGLNEGRVPTAVIGDAFLPESLRQQLGLKTNAERLARDACILQTLVFARQRRGRCDIFLGRTSAGGDPLRPSRLLLACGEAELPARVRFLFREVESNRASVPWQRAWRLEPTQPLRPVARMPVTGFRQYLSCPFRFYLRYGLRMEEVDASKAELDARDFGNLVHFALEAMGRETSLRGCADPAALRDFLLARLGERARQLYGAHPPLPVVVQVESARQRLGRAAEIQAGLHREGWEIEEVELALTFHVGALEVRAKVDRIDRHRETGLRRVLDYKTRDQPEQPDRAHVRRIKAGEDASVVPDFARFEVDGVSHVWIDLQLPLYLHALAPRFEQPPTCGYFNLPKAANETSVALWPGHSAEWQAAAWRCAEGVAEAVSARRFWPPQERPPRLDEFAPLFHNGAAESIAWPLPSTEPPA